MSTDPTLSELLRDVAEREHVLEAVVAALDDPHGFLDLVLSEADVDTVLAELQRRGFSEVQAEAVTYLQLQAFSPSRQQRTRADLLHYQSVRRDLLRRQENDAT